MAGDIINARPVRELGLMKRTLACLALLLGPPLSAAACLWDRDTPAEEALGMPEVVAALTGRFDRNPPLFYKRRLARVADHLRCHPEDLGAFDDAGVACDRLGRGVEAIAWMDRKRAQLESIDEASPALTAHWYRYHANLGTFLAHHWFRRGADRAQIDEVNAARDEIARALEINPNAHHGRERYQLQALEWIIDPPEVGQSQELPNLLGWDSADVYDQETDPEAADDAVRGLAGLIVLGDAWESVDVFHAFNVALQLDSVGHDRGREGGRNTLAYFAWLRCRELIDAGQGSILPGAARGEDLKALLPRPDFVGADHLLDNAYRELRDEAEARHDSRVAFMTRRLKAGLHPDTNPQFWNGYNEPPPPSLPTRSVPDAYRAWHTSRMRMAFALVIGVPTLAAGLIVVLLTRARRHRIAGSSDWTWENSDDMLLNKHKNSNE